MKTDIGQVIHLMEDVGSDLVKWQRDKGFRDHKVSYKAGKEVVSELDKAAEVKIRQGVMRLYPNHKIWGEEFGRDKGQIDKEQFLIIDPIDGSKNYLSGNPLFATQIACLEGGKIKWGVIVLPGLAETYSAIAGAGAFRNGKKIYPSVQTDLGLALQCFGIGHEATSMITLAQLLGDKIAEPRHYGSAGVHYCFVASGITDIYIAQEAKYYDMAPGLVICQEAGLEFCDLKGNPFTHGEENTGVVIANKELLAQFKALVTTRSQHFRLPIPVASHKNRQ